MFPVFAEFEGKGSEAEQTSGSLWTLVVAIGYGDSVEDAGKVVGKSGDGGIDTVIKQDRIGLDAIYVQAKRWRDAGAGKPPMKTP